MPEDWNAIAAEVDEALRSVADVSQAAGFPVTLRTMTTVGGDPWNPGSGTTTPSYTTLYGVSFEDRLRDENGALVGKTMRTLTVGATGAVPDKTQQVAIGVAEADVNDATIWQEIIEVRALAPAGIAVLYELDLAS